MGDGTPLGSNSVMDKALERLSQVGQRRERRRALPPPPPPASVPPGVGDDLLSYLDDGEDELPTLDLHAPSTADILKPDGNGLVWIPAADNLRNLRVVSLARQLLRARPDLSHEALRALHVDIAHKLRWLLGV